MPLLLDCEEVRNRLEIIFPQGLTNRNYLTREMSAKSIFVLLYIDAVEGRNVWLRPNQITRMTDLQAALVDDESRKKWDKYSTSRVYSYNPGQWYADNTREPIRDETLRDGLVECGCVIVNPKIPTTSPKGRYALTEAFSELFNPAIDNDSFEGIAHSWREKYLSQSALARLRLLKHAVTDTSNKMILAHFPNGETRQLAPGKSSLISKAVIEEFSKHFLETPVVLWLSESANKEHRRDKQLAEDLGLKIEADRYLPDLILVDIAAKEEPLFVFIEVVATDGPITEKRKEALQKIVTDAGYKKEQCTFITAYSDRGQVAFKKTFSTLAWKSFAWCASEPKNIIGLHTWHSNLKIRDLILIENKN